MTPFQQAALARQQRLAVNRVIVLDRDGVINEDVVHPNGRRYCSRWEDWKWTPGALEAMESLKRDHYRLAIVTNQNGISRGDYTKEDYNELMLQANDDAKTRGFPLAWPSIWVGCYHGEEAGCQCRKPGTLLWEKWVQPFFDPVDLENSWMVGDRESDMEFGRRIGLKTAKIPEQFSSLHSFAEHLLARVIPIR